MATIRRVQVTTFIILILSFPNIAPISSSAIPEWLATPCDGRGDYGVFSKVEAEEMARSQLKIFSSALAVMINDISKGFDNKIEIGRTCPNIKRMISRLAKQSEMRVFYNLIRKWAIFLEEIISELPTNNNPRRSLYQHLLNHLKLLGCQYRQVLGPHETKPSNFKLRSCFESNWTHTNSGLFDLYMLKAMQIFFSKCAAILYATGTMMESYDNDSPHDYMN